MRYLSLWRWTWTLVAVGGVGLAILEWSAPAVVVIVLVVTAVIVALVSLLTGDLVLRRGASGSVSHLVTWAVVVASAGTGLLALATVSPPVALLVVLLAALTSPPFVALLTRSTTDRSRPAHEPAPREEPAAVRPAEEPPVGSAPPAEEDVVVATLSDQQLFCLWRRTFWDLTSSAALDDRLAVISLRQSCLEELERRDPDGLTAWLDSGARASGGPERFWHTPRPGKDVDGA